MIFMYAQPSIHYFAGLLQINKMTNFQLAYWLSWQNIALVL